MIRRALVLMYHAIVTDSNELTTMDPQDAAYALPVEVFNRQLDMLASSETLRVVRPEAVFEAQSLDGEEDGDARLPVCLTFDDSLMHHATVALPALTKRDWTAAAFISTGELDAPGRLNTEQARALVRAGWCVGGHGREHVFLTSLDEGGLMDSLTRSLRELAALDEATRPWLSLPGGRGDARVVQAAREAGYERIFGSFPGVWEKETVEPIPRCVIRAEPTGTDLLRNLISDPDGTTRRLMQAARWRAWLRRVCGDRFYHWLHGMRFRLGRGGSGGSHA